ncbi:MAG: protein kinase [Myxococcales bacterium]|nr:protein kinase [Myxococcales bacterium]
MTITPGLVIDGKYSITRLIGEGGMGAVYEGTNVLIRRRVAIKVLLAGAREANGVLERFEREAQAAGCIGNDHILEVLDLGTLPSGDRYMVMEYLDGESLADRIRRRGRLTPEEVGPLLRQALVGLDAAHRAGIVHRDLKPDNIFVLKEKAGRPDFVKIIDFGISKFNALGGDMSMTRTGTVMGTPYYMSPEQAKGAGGVTHQSDLYSMGVIAFEAVSGQVPFDGESFNDLMFKIVLGETPNLRELVPGIDPAFVAIVERAMKRDLSERFESAEQFIAAIDSWRPRGRTVPDGTPAPAELLAAATSVEAAAKSPSPTNLDWAASQTVTSTSKKAPLFPALLATGAVLLLAGGGLAWWSASGGDDGADSPVAATEGLTAEEVAAAEAPAAEPTGADRAAEKPAEPAEAKEPPAKAAEPAAADRAAEKPTEPAEEPKKDDTPAAAPPPSTTAPATTKPSRPAPARPKPSTPSSSKPKSTVPDFGY